MGESIDKRKKDGGVKKKKWDSDRNTRTTVTIPYIKGVLEALSQVFVHHGVVTTMKPHLTLKRMLVHTKDKRTPPVNARVVYHVPWKDCRCLYTGETGRRYEVGGKEH